LYLERFSVILPNAGQELNNVIGVDAFRKKATASLSKSRADSIVGKCRNRYYRNRIAPFY
jgi:hypothetical protein